MKTTFTITRITILSIVYMFTNMQVSMAQINPMGSVYFQNQYLGNPALAGSQKGLNIDLAYRKQFTTIPGTPVVQSLTANTALTTKVGLGLNVYSDKAGLLKRTRTVASYSYHLPVGDEDQKLSFGLSFGFMNERISDEDINGDSGDSNIETYSHRETYLDGDFGIAYSTSGLNVQMSVPNMKSFFRKEQANNLTDRSTFFSALSYKLHLNNGIEDITAEPKICYRGVKDFGNIIDAGLNIDYTSKLNAFAMYHSSQDITVGAGLNCHSVLITGMYNSNPSTLRSGGIENAGNIEFSLTFNLIRGKSTN